MIGLGTALNVGAILAGATIGSLVGHRFPERTREVITQGLGMVTLLVAALSAVSVTDPALSGAMGRGVPVLVVLGAMLVGGVIGSLLGIERWLERLGGGLQKRFLRDDGGGDHRFVEGFVSSSLVFSVGPLAVLGALSDGLGRGIDQLALKSMLDFFTAIAFAASFGWGVAAAGLSVLVVQGLFTVAGFALGGVLPDPHVAALDATGGLLLAGVGLRLLKIKEFPTGDLLPALLFAPLLTALAIAVS
ncbi:DUF554 domain-containing protein [Actinosynnema sp. NPDC050801]|jgi:uncharacterized membrane protein YqgA involved in biofilm formation|uniref:DUF554 domain-containing protein n=1 Tax=unclassified Actinosynnema TaxID=2637065 RepID=UPI0033CF6DEA